jgi:SAM-dependent methyltransferase
MVTRGQLDAAIDRYGPWTAHNIEVAPGLYTRPQDGALPNPRIRQILQLVEDIATPAEVTKIRIADLGCLEGGFGIELALHGAEVVGIEGRESNVARARFAATALSLDLCSFEKDDVRNFSADRYGHFDIVLCLGLLYHLDADSVFDLLNNIYACTRRALILDTHVSLTGGYGHKLNDRTYQGHLYREHRSTDSAAQVLDNEWASLDNPESFWPTRSALYDALAITGFSSVLECHLPQSTVSRPDRLQLVAFKGIPVDIRSVPQSAMPLAPYSQPSVPLRQTGLRNTLMALVRETRPKVDRLRKWKR